MPTYDYECLKCGYVFEAFQNITQKPLRTCPKCKGKLKRLIGGGVGLIFKGSGFYATDYKKKAQPSNKEKNSCKRAESHPESKSCPKQVKNKE